MSKRKKAVTSVLPLSCSKEETFNKVNRDCIENCPKDIPFLKKYIFTMSSSTRTKGN